MAAELRYSTLEMGDDGVNIRLTYEDAVDAVENQEIVDASPFILEESQFPLVATGFFHNDGDWFFYATHGEGTEYELEYNEFIEALHETA